MDGKGGYTDPDYIGMNRPWLTVKYEEVYLKAYTSRREANTELPPCFHFYNTHRPHQAPGYRTPAEVFNRDSAQSTEQN